MKSSIKIIFGYLFLLIESIIFLLLILFTTLKFTLLNSDYIKNEFEKKDYYKKLTSEIKTEMSYYTNQSGFEDSILDNVFTEKEVKNVSESFIDSLYTGKKFTIDTKNVEENLNKNINEFLKDENFKITNSAEVQKFVKEMTKIYSNEIKLMGYIDSVGNYIPKINDKSFIILLGLVIGLIVCILINRLLFKRKDFSIIFYTSSFLLLFLTIYMKNSIDINNISIYSELVSDIIKTLVNNFLSLISIISFTSIGIGLIIDIITKRKKL